MLPLLPPGAVCRKILSSALDLHIMLIIMKKRKAVDDDLIPDEVTREHMLAVFALARDRGLFSQEKLQAELGIDQGQISKILRGDFVFPRGHARRIFEYANNLLSGRPDIDRDVKFLKEELTRKLMIAWDQTPEGAVALGVLLDGAARLRARR